MVFPDTKSEQEAVCATIRWFNCTYMVLREHIHQPEAKKLMVVLGTLLGSDDVELGKEYSPHPLAEFDVEKLQYFIESKLNIVFNNLPPKTNMRP